VKLEDILPNIMEHWMDKIKILLVDDEKDTLDAMRMGLEVEKSYEIMTSLSRNEAINIIKSTQIDVVVTDLKLKDGSGLDIVNYIQEQYSEISIIVVTAFGSVESAIEAVRGGAYDYLQKPIRLIELKRVINRLAEHIHLKKENEKLKRQLGDQQNQAQLIGISPKFKEILELIKQVAPAQSTVLVTGESGTGKEMVASSIHFLSSRHNKPFVTINCAAIPESLIEAELFGYEKGAFTGAQKQKKGKIELAHQGTLLLDEIGELPKSMQVKLLRVLQNGQLEHLGGTETIKVDVRIIAATNADLEMMVKKGAFREDLYYRLNVITIHMPPLREREEDIIYLTQHFINKYNSINQKRIEGLDPKVIKEMKSYPWKGNIRELENMIERAVVLSKEKILKLHHFPLFTSSDSDDISGLNMKAGMSLAEVEKEAIKKTLRFHHYDKNKTAMSLQIGLATLYRKMKEYDLDVH
jgi:DNA-binding NtrC family response regulator